jgi:hypothetical protein
MMHQASCTAGAVLLVLVAAAASTGDQPNPAEQSEPVLVDVSGPMIVGFLWSGSRSSSESDEKAAVLQSALEDVAKCLKNENVSVRMEFALAFRLRNGGSEETIQIPRNQPRSVGAILVRPGVHSRIVYAYTLASPSHDLRITAAEYFNAPACRPDR